MPNYRFLLDQPCQTGDQITLNKTLSQHICKVLRLTTHDKLSVFHPEYGEFNAQLLEANHKHALITIQHQIKPKPMPPTHHLHLAQVISRGERMDFSIQKATELGVDEITPIISKRCGVQLSKERLQKRMLHWQGVIESAVQQCGRIDVPHLNDPIALNHWLAQPRQGDCFAAMINPNQNKKPNFNNLESPITVIIGPEGGFTPEEEQHMLSHQVKPWQLGPRVLRTETAGIVALTLLQYHIGDFG